MSLILPIALWSNPPPHSITSTLIIVKQEVSVLVTGSNSGQICVWSLEFDKQREGINPLIFCLGHSAPINALVESTFEDTDAFTSISSDGVLHTWRALDGKCLKGGQFTSFHPLSLASIPGGSKLIALAGCHCDIELIDSSSLKSVSTLRGHQDWVTCLGTTLSSNNEPVLLSASRDGLVHFWSVKPNENTPLRTVCVDEGPLPDISPLSVVISPDVRSFVIVTPKEWLLYTAHNSQFICSVACPISAEWLSAKYLDHDTLLVWTSQALAAVYRLRIPSSAETLSLEKSVASILTSEVLDGANPKTTRRSRSRVKAGSAFLPIISNQRNEDESSKSTFPTLLYTLNEFPSDPLSRASSPISGSLLTPRSSSPLNFMPITPRSMSSSPVASSSSSTPPSQEIPISRPERIDLHASTSFSFFDPTAHRYESSFSQFAACSNNYFAVGDANGQVGLWSVKRDSGSHWSSGKISDGWKGINSTPGKAVTATLVLEDSLILIRGHENGQLSSSALPTDAFPKYYKAHGARVNCLLCSPIMGGLNYSGSFLLNRNITVINSIPKRHLISGSDDFTIKVWELPTFDSIHTFTHHTGPITSLFLPPPLRQRRPASDGFWNNTFFAVSEDKCVGLYSMDGMRIMHLFGVHPALVSAVRCKWEQDYLMVECVDGAVAVWEIGTGELEGIVYGQVAHQICENSDLIWSSNNHPYGVARAATSSITEPGGPASKNGGNSGSSAIGVRVAYIPSLLHRSPIQMIYLDIKHLVRELYELLPHPAFVPPPSPSRSSHQSTSFVNSGSLKRGKNVSTLAINDNGKTYTLNSKSTSSIPARQRQSIQIGSSNSNPAILHLPSYQVFSYLIPWGIDRQMDNLLKREVLLRPPAPQFAFGMTGSGVNLSIMVPAASESGKWKLSIELSAIVTLSAVSYTKALINLADSKSACVQILNYYCSLLPDILATKPPISYVDTLLPFLASFWLDSIEDLMSAARSILFSIVDRLSSDTKRELTQSLASQLKNASEYQRGLMTVVLGIIGSERPDALDETAAKITAYELLKILYKGGTGPFTQGAVELLGKGFAAWRPHLKDVARLIRALFTLALQNDSLGQSAHHSLLLVGAQDPRQFIVCIGAEIHRDTQHSHLLPNNSAAAVMVLGSMVKKDPCAILTQLPRLVETVVKSLDPHSPILRDACLKATTAVLHVMVTKYPMVSFHQESQRLAVGTGDNAIVVYDLKTATRWHMLMGHKNTISAVAFTENGKALASYSLLESAVRIWQTSNSFFGILGGTQPQCVKNITVSQPPKPIPLPTQLQTIRLQWISPGVLTLHRGWEADVATFEVDPA